MKRRKINSYEIKIVEKIAKDAKFSLSKDFPNFEVIELEDGSMGSIAFIRNDKLYEERKLGGVIGKFDYRDSDGIDILMTLFKDSDGFLYELDVWKGSLEPRISYPEL